MDVTAAAFVDAATVDFHLRDGYVAAIDRGMPLADAGLDIDGQPHGPRPDIGADERTPALCHCGRHRVDGAPSPGGSYRMERQ